MCIGCTWSSILDGATAGPGLSRRRVLQGGLAAGTIAMASPLFAALPAAAEVNDGPADVIFHNGPVYTVDPKRPWAEAVAVQGKTIVYVGDAAGVETFRGSTTRIVDLRGKLLLPGFAEGHIHPLLGAPLTRGIDLQYDTREEVLAALRAYADTAPDRGAIHGVVRGFGWRYLAFPPSGPTRQDIDAVWPDIPVFFTAIDAHSAWVNSKTLALAGITKDTPPVLPGFSYFAKDPVTGEPTGYVVEAPAVQRIVASVAPFSHAFIVESLEEWLPKASAAGITTVFDAGMAVVAADDGFAIYEGLEAQGRLPFRVVGSLYYNEPKRDPLPDLEALVARHHTELVEAKVLKIVMDGVDANGSAAMLAPYADNPASRGDTIFTPAETRAIVERADAKGFDIHFHAIGDRAARQALDALEAAIAANPPRDRRHCIAHNQLTDPADIPRFGKLGVIAEFSGQWHCRDGAYWQSVTVSRWGEERARREYRVEEIRRAGAPISLGTDWPAGGNSSVYHPLHAIETAVTRQGAGKPNDVPLTPLEDRLTLAEAIYANTMGTAFQTGLEDRIGSIAVGKFADLIVLDRNIFEIPIHEVHAVRVQLTLMNGEVRHDTLT
ncbi:amidohydrolase [Segnochrobactrum spirostomi]|uniref:Amidohydrolase n=1 Tax=Segnochrobactrum spirostomi TaxID=2608987 RepID=A0A6A7XXH5_9HYPH|nr:amidohydrolase [Segnochrobactrum spirostomi]MQT11314.1 amidohydrolase [Segnochrobactrum spirostomi]